MRLLILSLCALLVASGAVVATADNAAALGGESLACRVTPSRNGTFRQTCSNDMGASTYQVSFVVQNETAPSSYTWSVTVDSGYYKITSGCSATSNNCVVSVPNVDADINASVTLTQSGATETLYSRAFIGQYCGSVSCA